MNQHKKISVVIPCYNEEKYVDAVVQTLVQQDYPKECVEVVFADGLSTDQTKRRLMEHAQRHPNIRVIDNEQRYVPTALNKAIQQSTGEIIVRMDAHAFYPQNYLSVLARKLEEHKADNVGGVCVTQPGADTAEAKAIALATSHPLGIGNASFRLAGQKERDVDTVPFGCFRRELFDRIGYFDPQLIRNQDDEFNGRIKRAGGKIILIPSLEIQYFARPTFKKLSAMYYQYGLFKPLVNLKLGAPATARQFAPPLFVLSILLGSVVSLVFPLAWIPLCTVVFAYLLAISITSLKITGLASPNLFFHTVLAFPVLHFSYGWGYLRGLFKYALFKHHLRSSTQGMASTR